jgi:hypothetical protein
MPINRYGCFSMRGQNSPPVLAVLPADTAESLLTNSYCLRLNRSGVFESVRIPNTNRRTLLTIVVLPKCEDRGKAGAKSVWQWQMRPSQ